MQELAHHVYIETSYAGVTLAAINWAHGLILIDSPFRVEDTRSWRSALLNLGGGVDRLMINLDGHFDRTIGSRAMDCTVVGHEKMAAVFRNRPVTFKTQGNETGADWELYNGLGSIRWAPPEITFSERMFIHWENDPLVLEYHQGPSSGSIWAVLPGQKIALVGDAVMPDQPPYLAAANLPAWIASLELLLTEPYIDYLLVSGRGGLVAQEQVRSQIAYLQKVHHMVEDLSKHKGTPEAADKFIPELLSGFTIPEGHAAQYEQRLRSGLRQYYLRHYTNQTEDIEE